MALCRIRYFGNEDRSSFAWYTYAHEKYEPSFLLTGELLTGEAHGTQKKPSRRQPTSSEDAPGDSVPVEPMMPWQDYASNPPKLWVKVT